jgi:EmrB/QacA subfamily drug resistance transporter
VIAPAPTVVLTRRRILLVLTAIVLGNIMAGVEGTIVATARPFIVGDLGRFELSAWIFIAYQLTSAVTTNLWGKFSDLFGRKKLYQLSLVVFMCGSLTCGLSTSMIMLIFGRAIQGVGSGGLFALGMVIMGDVLSPRERGKYVGYMAATYGMATVVGPFVGGFIVDNLSWRWIFFMMMPFGIAALVLSQFTLRLPFARRERAIDYAGAITMTVWVTAFVLYGELSGTNGFTDPRMLAIAATGVLSLALFIRAERRAVEPVLPLRLFRDRTFALASAAHVSVGAVSMVVGIMAPLWLQFVGGVSATRSGVLSMPMVVGMLVAAVICGQLMSRTGRYRIFPIVGSGTMFFAVALMATIAEGTPNVWVASYMFFVGAGSNATTQVLIVAVQNQVPYGDLGIATSAVTFFRGIGQVAGSAVYSALLVTQLDHWLPQLVPGGQFTSAAQLQLSPNEVRALEPAVRDGVVTSYANGLHAVFLWLVPLCIISVFIALAVREHPLREEAPIAQHADDMADAVEVAAAGH